MKTYDPADIVCTFTPPGGEPIELKGFEMPEGGFITSDPPWPRSTTVFRGTCKFTCISGPRRWRFARRFAIRAHARARKLRRGW